MKRVLVAIIASCLFSIGHAQSSSSATQTSTSNSTSASSGNQSTNTNSSSAVASPSSTSSASSYGNVGNSMTASPTSNSTNNNGSTSTAGSTASNAGNSQTIQFITPQPTPEQQQAASKAAQELAATPTTATVRQEVSGGTDSTQHVEYSGTQTIKNVPSVNGPPLTTSNDTCMGSSSGSINGPGFGIGLGSTWRDTNCVMLKNAREMWNMGMKAAAMALMCMDENNRTALEITGFVCPQTAAAQKAAQAVDEREALRKRVAELEGQQKKKTSWLGREDTPLPPPVVNPSAPPMTAPTPVVERKPEPVAVSTPVRAGDVMDDGSVVIRVLEPVEH